jgi:hypothetical protein
MRNRRYGDGYSIYGSEMLNKKWLDGFLLNIPCYFTQVILLPSISGGNLFFLGMC